MSVLKSKRAESKAQYINLAYEIHKETLQFLSKLSSKYARLLAPHVMDLSANLLSNAEKANSFYISDEQRRSLRKEHLLLARANLMALDVHLSIVYDLLRMNPQGSFTNANDVPIPANKAMVKLDNMSESLGSKIDKENAYLTALLKRCGSE